MNIKKGAARVKKLFLIFILLMSLVMSTSIGARAEGQIPKEICQSENFIKLQSEMQELWIEHAWWTRSYIVSNLAGLADQNKVLERLLQNQVDIGNIIKPYYGEQAGTKLTELLKEHILIAGKIIDAAKSNNQANVEKLNKQWYQNADEMVSFLIRANPNWSQKELTDMFYTHLKLTTDEVTYRLKRDWEKDIKTADINEVHLIHMGDLLTSGIVKQFPQKF